MEFQKYNVKENKEKNLKKKTRSKKIIKNIYMKFALKSRVSLFFCKVIGYKNENSRRNRGLKNKKNFF